MESQTNASAPRLPRRLQLGLAFVTLSVAYGCSLLFRGASGQSLAIQWGGTFMLAALVVVLVSRARRDAVLQSGESKREPRLGWIVSPTLSLVLYLAAVLLYGYSTKLQLADESPWSTAAFVSVALYAGLIVAPWFVWRGIR